MGPSYSPDFFLPREYSSEQSGSWLILLKRLGRHDDVGKIRGKLTEMPDMEGVDSFAAGLAGRP
jgi:hypothetical protein